MMKFMWKYITQFSYQNGLPIFAHLADMRVPTCHNLLARIEHIQG